MDDVAEQLHEVEREIAARRPEHQISPTLDRIAMLTSMLGDPQRAFQVIHVTGTNGKTSMTRMIDSLLRERGLRTGRFTSPHLVSMRERICIDGVPLEAGQFVELYEELRPYIQLTDDRQPAPLSFFEVLVGMAYAAFADAPVDVAVIEVGMGGRWDATNVADGAVAVIGPVALDHTQWLGDTIEAIATEKAGIIKPGAVAVLAQQPRVAAAEVVLERAAAVGAPVMREGIEFGVLAREMAVAGQSLTLRGLRAEYDEVYLPLFGAYQAGNAACALAAVEAFAGVANAAGSQSGTIEELSSGGVTLRDLAGGGASAPAGQYGLSPAGLDINLVRDGFAKVSSPGRLEILRRSPTVIADSSHNPAGMAATLDAVQESFRFSRLIAVVAVSADKDVAAILDNLEPAVSEIVVTTNSQPRSMPAAELGEIATEIFGEERVIVASRLDEAIEAAVALADEPSGPDEIPGSSAVLITGSVITAGDARALLAPGRAADGDVPPPPGTPSRHSFTVGDLS
ncbi:MAG TPA: folylpolyglutamate synthase/dihydrofolate synthase family protein [Trebonia sp.]|nr:folylpolyglutamate synthase/dihydrofolate synthase family protein [Trebonia sp.]